MGGRWRHFTYQKPQKASLWTLRNLYIFHRIKRGPMSDDTGLLGYFRFSRYLDILQKYGCQKQVSIYDINLQEMPVSSNPKLQS